jgi:hypothetical protein
VALNSFGIFDSQQIFAAVVNIVKCKFTLRWPLCQAISADGRNTLRNLLGRPLTP